MNLSPYMNSIKAENPNHIYLENFFSLFDKSIKLQIVERVYKIVNFF